MLGEVRLEVAERAATGDLPTGDDVWPALVELVAIATAEQQGGAYLEVPTETVVPTPSPLAGVPRRIATVVEAMALTVWLFTPPPVTPPWVVRQFSTRLGHWYATYDTLNGNNDRVCRGCDGERALRLHPRRAGRPGRLPLSRQRGRHPRRAVGRTRHPHVR